MAHVIGRRALLTTAGAFAATALAGCFTPSAAPSATPSATPAVTLPSTSVPTGTAPPPSATLGPPDWSALRSALKGTLVLPSDGGYDRVRLLYNTRFDGTRPQAIARCANAADVRECVLFARRYALPLAIRSGGHSYAGYSTGPGLVIDMRPLNAIELNGDLARIGAGAQLIDVYSTLGAKGVGIPAGSCPSVALAGLALAGGLGVLSRAWGLTCDNIAAAEVVTADGAIRTCDERRDADLFWALRGGGGGSFCVVTSLTLRARPITRLALGFFQWEPARARDVLGAWQKWIRSAPDALWSNVHLSAGPSPEVAVHATFLGDQSALSSAFDDLVRAVGTAPSYREVGSLPYVDTMLLEAGCLGRSVAQCHLKGDTADGALERETYAAASVVIEQALSSDGIDAIMSILRPDRAPPGSGAAIVDSLGGAVARIAPDATAFPHRRALATVQILASWSATAPAAVADQSRAWLRGYRDTLRAAIGRGAYVGYIDADLADWQSAYYGANYARLQQVKKTYDPSDVFTFAQSIRLP
jgi:FAD/FMN-containing dehydrogenase